MKTLRIVLLISIVLGFTNLEAQSSVNDNIEWHSYAQLRFASDFNTYNNFSVRRLKFWMKSKPEFSKKWTFKVQAIFMSLQKEKFFLQDAYGQYNWKHSNIRFGQFIPRFSLQRFQPDYLIPSMERARAVSILIPNGTHGVRDIGVQYNLNLLNKKLKANFGIFNGYGIKDYRFDNAGILLVHHLSYKFKLKSSNIKIGYSVSYRNADNMNFGGIISDSIPYSSYDFRYNFYGIFTSKFIDVQAEYLKSQLEVGSANGYYALVTLKPNNKHHFYLMYDKYDSDDSAINSNVWYISGYNYLINKYKIMLSLETGFQKDNNKWSNRTVLQFQMFLH